MRQVCAHFSRLLRTARVGGGLRAIGRHALRTGAGICCDILASSRFVRARSQRWMRRRKVDRPRSASPAHAIDSPPSPSTPPPTPSTVTVEFGGRVVDADAGGPLANVRLSVSVWGSRGGGLSTAGAYAKEIATSGGDGTFTLALSLPSDWTMVFLKFTGPAGYDDTGGRFEPEAAACHESPCWAAADRPAIRMYPTLVIRPGESIEVRVDWGIVWCGWDRVPCRRVVVGASPSDPVELEVVPDDNSKPMALAVHNDFLQPDISVRRLMVPPGGVPSVIGSLPDTFFLCALANPLLCSWSSGVVGTSATVLITTKPVVTQLGTVFGPRSSPRQSSTTCCITATPLKIQGESYLFKQKNKAGSDGHRRPVGDDDDPAVVPMAYSVGARRQAGSPAFQNTFQEGVSLVSEAGQLSCPLTPVRGVTSSTFDGERPHSAPRVVSGARAFPTVM